MSYNIAIIGATGIVGSEFLKLLENSKIDIQNLLLFASKKSENKKIKFRNFFYSVKALNNNTDLQCFKNIDFAIFAAGSKVSLEFIPLLQKNNTYIIDLSSAFRNDKNIPLIIPEINFDILKNYSNKVIASPNCTTTIMLMALHDLHKNFKIKRIVASTYQAASGGGIKLMNKLLIDTKNALTNPTIKNDYGFNIFLHESKLNDQRYSLEEQKMILETKKILQDNSIKITATCVRVPVIRAHSISINVQFDKKLSITNIYDILKKAENVKIFEDYKNNKFASPQDASFKPEVLISRIRKDISHSNTFDMWVCADQLLKGASFNAFQILEKIISQKALK